MSRFIPRFFSTKTIKQLEKEKHLFEEAVRMQREFEEHRRKLEDLHLQHLKRREEEERLAFLKTTQSLYY